MNMNMNVQNKDLSKYDVNFLEIAKVISKLSKDPSMKVGAVISGKYNQLISQGYNGFPRGVDDKFKRLENREVKYSLIAHAEANAIYNAGHNGAKLHGCTIYINGLPCCSECSKAVIQTGIKRVVMNIDKNNKRVDEWMKSFETSKLMFDESGVDYQFVSISKYVIRYIFEIDEEYETEFEKLCDKYFISPTYALYVNTTVITFADELKHWLTEAKIPFKEHKYYE